VARKPPTLLTLARRALREHQLFGRGDTILCACSGGPDSNALLHVLALMRQQTGHTVVAAGIDHGLRAEANAELQIAADLAKQLDVRFVTGRVRVERGSNLQERARLARHQALQQIAEQHGAPRIALGHTADDRAETVLLRLLRGAGPRGLAAMPAHAPPPVSGDTTLIRPLILARRSSVLAHLARHNVQYATDPSNRDRRFVRVRVRCEVLPLLEELAPGVVAHLCALADMLAQASPDEDPLAGLGRAQRLEIARALRLGRSTTVRVSGGRDLSIHFERKNEKKA